MRHGELQPTTETEKTTREVDNGNSAETLFIFALTGWIRVPALGNEKDDLTSMTHKPTKVADGRYTLSRSGGILAVSVVTFVLNSRTLSQARRVITAGNNPLSSAKMALYSGRIRTFVLIKAFLSCYLLSLPLEYLTSPASALLGFSGFTIPFQTFLHKSSNQTWYD